MSKLWVFGDSYCLPNMVTHEWKSTPWPNLLGKNLGVSSIEIHAQYGVSNNYISYLLRENFYRIEPTDKIVIVTTMINRNWWFKDHPHLTNHNAVDNSLLTKNQRNAITQYLLEVSSNEFNSIISMENMMAWCRITANKINVPIAIIAGFEAINDHTSVGSLFEVDWKEHGSFEKKQMFLDTHNMRDPKDCHLHPDNHVILAEKICDYFKHEKPIDLTTGFCKDIIF